MELHSFKNKGSRDIALNLNSKEARKILPQSLFIVAIKKFRFIESVSSLEELSRYNSLRLEKLKGNRVNYFSIRINDQYRICLKEDKSKLYEIEIIDYHR